VTACRKTQELHENNEGFSSAWFDPPPTFGYIDTMNTLGLDEAGRGCVLGPLVVGGFLAKHDDAETLREAGADDSKRLSHKRRVIIREALGPLGTPILREISPAEIDAGNINDLEEVAFASIILETEPDHVIIDAPCNPKGIPAFQARLSERIRRGGGRVPTFTIEPKADANFAICGAASIFAKVHRDAHIHALGKVGSGYPSDPITRAWLKGFLERGDDLPDCVRKRWGTIENLRQQTLF
jgi:ribonuclease HII